MVLENFKLYVSSYCISQEIVSFYLGIGLLDVTFKTD
jgi:hypothetical protein